MTVWHGSMARGRGEGSAVGAPLGSAECSPLVTLSGKLSDHHPRNDGTRRNPARARAGLKDPVCQTMGTARNSQMIVEKQG